MSQIPTPLKEHLERLLTRPCIVTGRYGVKLWAPVGGSIVVRLGQRGNERQSDWLCVPMCEEAISGPKGIFAIGVEAFERSHGTMARWLDRMCLIYGVDLWANNESALAGTKRRKRYRERVKADDFGLKAG